MEEKFALITGTSSGLGLATAQMLLEQGWTVIGVSRSGSEIEHENYIDILCDIKDEPSVEEMYRLVSENTDQLDLIILNAGIFNMAPIVETSTQEFNDHLQTNVVGAYHILKHSLNFLLEDNSHIITISSIAAKMGMGNLAAYSASKYALTGMIESLRAEWRDYGFRFSTLFPGAIATGLWENIDSEIEFPKEQMMEVEDVLSVLDMVINSSSRVQFSEVIFTHKQGVIR